MPREITDEQRKRVKALGMNVRLERTRQELPLDGFARDIEMSKTALWRIEKGHAAPNVVNLMRIADGLGVPVAQLLDGV